jgi:hypothetical protein
VPNPGQKTITLSGEQLKQLERRYDIAKKSKSNLSFAAFIAESALMELERKDMIRETGFIAYSAFEDDVLFLKDSRKENRIFEVQLKNKKLKCLTDDTFDCAHVGFAMALPEVRKALTS